MNARTFITIAAVVTASTVIAAGGHSPAHAPTFIDVLVLNQDAHRSPISHKRFLVAGRQRAGSDLAVCEIEAEFSVVMLVDGTASQPLKRCRSWQA
jgi:hypothetical protein